MRESPNAIESGRNHDNADEDLGNEEECGNQAGVSQGRDVPVRAPGFDESVEDKYTDNRRNETVSHRDLRQWCRWQKLIVAKGPGGAGD
jgi:hypothetical protein